MLQLLLVPSFDMLISTLVKAQRTVFLAIKHMYTEIENCIKGSQAQKHTLAHTATKRLQRIRESVSWAYSPLFLKASSVSKTYNYYTRHT